MIGRQIDLQEAQSRLLRIAKSFDQICQAHAIPYFMLGGTMLGAIRHRGFIPWDDDMDFGVPIEHYESLRQLLKRHLPEDIRVCEFQNCDGCRTAFIKLDDTSTCIDDKCVDLPIEQKLGLNIDIFPLVSCPESGFEVYRHLFLTKFNSAVFTEPISGSKTRHQIKKVLRMLTPFSQNQLLHYLWHLTQSMREGDCYGNLFGRYRKREIVNKRIFGRETPYPFEDTFFFGPEHFDEYLQLLYGDYMQLPPLSQQTNHSTLIYERVGE